MTYLRILLAWALFLGSGAPSFANFAMSPSGTTTAFAIDASNQGTSLCAAASTECGAVVPINTAGSPLFTSTTPGIVSILQGGNTAVVKAASTAAAAADPSLVTNESPNSQLSTATGTTADSAWTSGSGSIVALLKAIATNVSAALPTGTNVIGGIFGSPNVTPTDCSLALTTGGTAQNIISASSTIHGFTIANVDTSAGSGEPVWFSLTTTAAASTIASYPLAAPTATTFANLSSYTTPVGFGNNHAVSVIAATTGHKISCTFW